VSIIDWDRVPELDAGPSNRRKESPRERHNSKAYQCWLAPDKRLQLPRHVTQQPVPQLRQPQPLGGRHVAAQLLQPRCLLLSEQVALQQGHDRKPPGSRRHLWTVLPYLGLLLLPLLLRLLLQARRRALGAACSIATTAAAAAAAAAVGVPLPRPRVLLCHRHDCVSVPQQVALSKVRQPREARRLEVRHAEAQRKAQGRPHVRRAVVKHHRLAAALRARGTGGVMQEAGGRWRLKAGVRVSGKSIEMTLAAGQGYCGSTAAALPGARRWLPKRADPELKPHLKRWAPVRDGQRHSGGRSRRRRARREQRLCAVSDVPQLLPIG
jgi:hypothetical protein